MEESGSYDVEALIETACSYASATLETEEQVIFDNLLWSTSKKPRESWWEM